MRVARVLYPVKVLGPGNRIGIWVCGCDRHCRGCANPELWDVRQVPDLPVDELWSALQKLIADGAEKPDGVVISGGEPFVQSGELEKLVSFLKPCLPDILVFTGFTLRELQEDEAARRCLPYISVLVDGEYREEENCGEVLRGSANQQIHYLDASVEPRYAAYQRCMDGKCKVQNFRTQDGMIAVGIHRSDFRQQLAERMQEKSFRIFQEGVSDE